MKILSDFGTDSHRVEPHKTIKYSDVVDVLDTYLENVDLTLDKIKVDLFRQYHLTESIGPYESRKIFICQR